MYTYMQQQKWKEQTVKVVMTYLILNMLKYYLVYSMVIYHLSAPQHSKVPWISPALPSVMPCQCHATPPPTSAPKHGLRTSRSPGLRWSCGSYLWAVVTLTKKTGKVSNQEKKGWYMVVNVRQFLTHIPQNSIKLNPSWFWSSCPPKKKHQLP